MGRGRSSGRACIAQILGSRDIDCWKRRQGKLDEAADLLLFIRRVRASYVHPDAYRLAIRPFADHPHPPGDRRGWRDGVESGRLAEDSPELRKLGMARAQEMVAEERSRGQKRPSVEGSGYDRRRVRRLPIPDADLQFGG